MRSLSLGRRPAAFLCLSFHSSVQSERGGRTTEGMGLCFQNYFDMWFSGNAGVNLATVVPISVGNMQFITLACSCWLIARVLLYKNYTKVKCVKCVKCEIKVDSAVKNSCIKVFIMN